MWDMVNRAMRRSRPVTVMAAAINRAAATSARPELEKPPRASLSAFWVPITLLGSAISGALPTRKMIRAEMRMELTV